MGEVKRYKHITLFGNQCLCVSADDYDALRAENAELKRDAVRYRFARALENDCWMLNTLQRVSGAELDSAIDAALAKHRCATQPTDKP